MQIKYQVICTEKYIADDLKPFDSKDEAVEWVRICFEKMPKDLMCSSFHFWIREIYVAG